LGRRAKLPVHECHAPEEAEDLFRSILALGEPSEESLGTWALFHVEAWPRELQVSLLRIIERLDESRLHGKLRHERIPRVVVIQERESEAAALDPNLKRRLSYFDVSVTETGTQEPQ